MKQFKYVILRMSPEGHLSPYSYFYDEKEMDIMLEALSNRELMNTPGWMYIGVKICKNDNKRSNTNDALEY